MKHQQLFNPFRDWLALQQAPATVNHISGDIWGISKKIGMELQSSLYHPSANLLFLKTIEHIYATKYQIDPKVKRELGSLRRYIEFHTAMKTPKTR